MTTYSQVGLIYTDGTQTAAEVARVLTSLGRDNIAIAYLISGVRSVKSTSDLPTACMDSQHNIQVNPAFWDKLPPPNRKSLLAHECLHMGLDHFSRLGSRDLKLFNIATDAVINTIVEEGMGLPPIVFDRILPPQGYVGPLVSEDIYAYYKANPNSQPFSGSSDGSPGKGCGIQGEIGEIGEIGEGEAGEGAPKPVDVDMDTFREFAKAGGGSMARVVALTEQTPTVRPQWKKLMRKTLSKLVASTSGNTHPSFSRIKQRNGLLSPTYRGSTPRCAIVLDVSGSMTEAIRAQLVAQCVTFAKEFPTINISIVAHTDVVVYAGRARAGSMKAVASAATQFTGGTLAQPAYDQVKRMCPAGVDLLVHATDREIESQWPRVPAKKLVVLDFGNGHWGTKPPEGSETIKMGAT